MQVNGKRKVEIMKYGETLNENIIFITERNSSVQSSQWASEA